MEASRHDAVRDADPREDAAREVRRRQCQGHRASLGRERVSLYAALRGVRNKWAAKYESLHPRFAKAFEFMRRPDLAELSCGRYEIDGSNCWATILDVALKPFEKENQYELHRAYIDIHAPISGNETIGVTTRDPDVILDFDVTNDCSLFMKKKGVPWRLAPGEFAIFLRGKGAHAPGLSAAGPRTIRKLVIKVRK